MHKRQISVAIGLVSYIWARSKYAIASAVQNKRLVTTNIVLQCVLFFTLSQTSNHHTNTIAKRKEWPAKVRQLANWWRTTYVRPGPLLHVHKSSGGPSMLIDGPAGPNVSDINVPVGPFVAGPNVRWQCAAGLDEHCWIFDRGRSLRDG